MTRFVYNAVDVISLVLIQVIKLLNLPPLKRILL